MGASIEWVAVDWGTSNVRAWTVGREGAPVFRGSLGLGMGRLSPEQYPGVLASLLGDFGCDGLEIVVCGMAGARQGWMEAPYLETPADLNALGEHAVTPAIADARWSVRILPGVCQRRGGDNVMRGEETQLLGLSVLRPGYTGPVCMPGTHSKWAVLQGSVLASFRTALTGELFDLLKTHSVLRYTLNGDPETPGYREGIEEGMARGLETPGLVLSHLFEGRAANLVSGRSSDWCSGFVSGLLVGTEVAGFRALFEAGSVPIIGSTAMSRLYAKAISMAGGRGEIVDATQATLAGLARARHPESGLAASLLLDPGEIS